MENGIFIGNLQWDINLYRKNKRYDLGGELIAKTIYTPIKPKVNTDAVSHHTIEKVDSNYSYNLGAVNEFIISKPLLDWNQSRKTLKLLANQYD